MKDATSDQESEESSSDSENLKPSLIAVMDFERRSRVPGFEIETHDDDNAFWVPVALQTRSHMKMF